MRGVRLTVGLDWDDVSAPCIQLIIDEINKKGLCDPPLSIEEFKHWGISTPRTKLAYQHFNEEWLYKAQVPYEGVREAVIYMQKYADVFINSAPPIEMMTLRGLSIREYLPEIKPENIILGSRKDIMRFDIQLDDNPQNVLTSNAKFPVLMRRPWNRELSGCLSVNSFQEFIKIFDTVRASYIEKESTLQYDMIAIVGPSGSGKNNIASALKDDYNYPRIYSYTTGKSPTHIRISEEEFAERYKTGDLFEVSYYAGEKYALSRADINRTLRETKPVVVVADIAGVMALKNHYNVLSVFTKQSERAMYENIIMKGTGVENIVGRLMSFEAEKHNENFCDMSVDAGNIHEAAQMIADVVEEKRQDLMKEYNGMGVEDEWDIQP